MSKPLSKKAFLQHVADKTADAGFTVEKLADEYLHINFNGQISRFSLATAYSAYQQAPDRLTDITSAHLSVLKRMAQLTPPTQNQQKPDAPSENRLATEPNGSAVPVAANADQLFLPVLQQRSWLTDMQGKVNSSPVYMPFVTNLIVAYVIDTPAFRTYLNEEMLARVLEQGAVTQQDVHEDALNNLRSLVRGMQIDTFNSFSETIITCETQEGYASSCILLPELMEEWSKRIPGDMLIGIPNRDFIIAFSHKHPAGIEGIEEQTAQDALKRDRPLSGRLLKWKDGQAQEFRPLN